MNPKKRLSALVEAELLQAAVDAVERGEAPTVSAWVNDALRSKAERDRRARALAEFVRAYETEHGEITPDEMREAMRAARGRTRVVRGASLNHSR
ncbi:MAG: hypothetical protein AAF219_07175 [Myxococcota bacterium]